MKKYYKGICPYCHSKVKGFWDWAKGIVCIITFCKKCNMYLLEDEVEW